MTPQQLLDAVSERFYEALTAKMIWSKNEIKMAFMGATIEALASAQPDLEVHQDEHPERPQTTPGTSVVETQE